VSDRPAAAFVSPLPVPVLKNLASSGCQVRSATYSSTTGQM
jgi:hypothetical protein